MIIDGRQLAEEVLGSVRDEVRALERSPSFVAFVADPAPATLSYLRIKERQAARAGITMRVHELPEEVTTEAVIDELQAAREDAVIVQLPLPEGVELMRVLEAIPEDKDADVLSPLVRSHGAVMHPIAASIKHILAAGGVSVTGARAVVVGQGWLVGQPSAAWLQEAGAAVAVVTKESGDLRELVPLADIVVSGAGSPGLITKDLVKEGAAVIDVGTSELGGSLRGDVSPDVAQVAGLYTPVPGGVGPLAVAYLMKNVARLARLRDTDNGVH